MEEEKKIEGTEVIKESWIDRHPFFTCLIFVASFVVPGCIAFFSFGFCKNVVTAIFGCLGIEIVVFFLGVIFWAFVWGADDQGSETVKKKGRVIRVAVVVCIWALSGMAIYNFWHNLLWSIIGFPAVVLGLAIFIGLHAAGNKDGGSEYY